MEINAPLVKQLRTAKQWSQEQLAEACGLNLRTIQRLETTAKASMESVRALAAVFELDANELIRGGKEPSNSMIRAVKDCFVKFANFTDTASRSEFWWFLLFFVLLVALATLVHEKANQAVSIVLILPLLAAGTRRLNDTGESAWWQLMYLVPFGVFLVFYFMAQPTAARSNSPG